MVTMRLVAMLVPEIRSAANLAANVCLATLVVMGVLTVRMDLMKKTVPVKVCDHIFQILYFQFYPNFRVLSTSFSNVQMLWC
jgi:hypothetical protein